MARYPNLRHIRLLSIAIERGSLTGAAEMVHISQPAASQAISKLRKMYGCPLLKRIGNSIAPTPEGLIVNNRGKRALELLHDADRRLTVKTRYSTRRHAGDLERNATVSQLRAISVFGRTGNFMAAAQSLSQAETSVRRAIKELEGVAGAMIIDGKLGAHRLTSIGEMLARLANLLLRELDTIFEELRENAGMIDGRVAVGTLPLARTRIIPEAIVAVAGQYPQASIQLVDGAYETLVHQLGTGELDMIVGALRTGPVSPALCQEALFEDELSVVARAGHPLTRLRYPNIGQLAEYPWIVARKDTPNRKIFESLFGPVEGGHVETASLATMRGILLISDYLTLISKRQVEYELRTGMLAEIPFRLGQTDRVIGVTSRREWLPTRLQREFLETLKNLAGESPRWD